MEEQEVLTQEEERPSKVSGAVNKTKGAGKKLARATFKGQEGSFFWLCEKAYLYGKEMIRAMNDYLSGRRAQEGAKRGE